MSRLAESFMAGMPEKKSVEKERPEHVEETEGGLACMHCGGEVGEDGLSRGDDIVDEDDGYEEAPQESYLDMQFGKATKGGR